ncbi:MAG: hypothetical protein WA584_09395 [Pyrinomonadaceae bacterium]
MDVWRQKTSIVSKLRVKGEKLDTVATRLYFERLFGADNFLSQGLPPKAIVGIRKLRDPSPRTLRLTRSNLADSDAWRNSVTREIEKLYRSAFRPVREMVPAQAQSVVFADNSELLACLARDWSEGLLAENWWWRSLFPNLQQAQTIARIWIESAEFAPFALQILAKQAKAVRFATKLQPNEISGLLRQIITVFGLDKLQTILFESFAVSEKFAASPPEKLIEKKKKSPRAFFFASSQTRAPWSEFVPETRHPGLSFEQQSLLGIGLMLARVPRIARSSEFARQVKIFRAEFEISRTTAQSKHKILKAKKKREIKKSPPLQKKSKSAPVLPESEIEARKSSEKKTVRIFEDSPKSVEKTAEPFDSSGDLKSEVFFPSEKVREKSKKPVFEDSPSEKTFDRQESAKETKSPRAEKPVIPKSASPKAVKETKFEFVEETDFELLVETRFGGVFYLLNLGLYLNLYRDFTESGEAEIDLNIWDFVALLGLKFLGRKIKKDPVWKLLEWLAGRENEKELGQGFTAPDAWRISPEWLKTFQTDQKWLWINNDKRLIVRHPAGFCVLDVPLPKDAKTQMENELKFYQKDFSELAESDLENFPKHLPPPENWLKNLAEYAQARLLQALNLETQAQINAILFERRAKITVTATHLDVTFSLADLPFEVRLSGLDRNPSWIPAVGKFVNFQFI